MENLENVSENVENLEGQAGEIAPENLGEQVVPDTTPKPEERTDTSKPSTPSEVIDWTKDNRYEKSWKKDPNSLYRSYRDLEKVYPPLKQQYESLNKMFEELNIQPDNLKTIMEEYSQFKDPENPIIQRAAYLSDWLDNPVYSTDVMNFFTELEKRDMSRKYPGMNEEQIKRMVEYENKVKSLEEKEQQRELEINTHKEFTSISKGFSEAEAIAKEYGFDFNEEIKQALLAQCSKENIKGEDIPYAFMRLYREHINKAMSAKIEQDVVKRQGKQKAGVITPAKGKAPESSKFNFKEKMLEVLKK